MVSAVGNVIPAGLKKQITAIKQLSRNADVATNQLASGLKVNRAFDNPLNFFTSQTLRFSASDLSRLLDGVGQSLNAIKTASDGVEAMLKLLDTAESFVNEALVNLFPETNETPDQRAIDYIVQKNPDKAYFDTLGNFYTNTTDFAPWHTARANAESAELTGVPEITGHLATITSQEENDVVFGLLTATSWLGGSDDEVEGVWRWVTGPEAGQQFWQGLAGGSAVDGSYENWAPGEPNQFFGPGNPENFAHLRADGLWNDLPASNNLNYIIEWGGDLFVQNPDVNVGSQAMDYRDQYLDVLEQIDRLAVDAQYRGINLLEGEKLETFFNASYSSSLVTEGINASSTALGLIGDNFISKTELSKLIPEIQAAREKLRAFGTTLQNNLTITQTRRDFIQNSVNTLLAGSDDLTLADQNKVGAELLAIQTRQAIQFQTLSLSAAGNARVATTLFA